MIELLVILALFLAVVWLVIHMPGIKHCARLLHTTHRLLADRTSNIIALLTWWALTAVMSAVGVLWFYDNMAIATILLIVGAIPPCLTWWLKRWMEAIWAKNFELPDRR